VPGAGAATACRSVLAGVMGCAARLGAVPINPVRDTWHVRCTGQRVKARSLTAAGRRAVPHGIHSGRSAYPGGDGQAVPAGAGKVGQSRREVPDGAATSPRAGVSLWVPETWPTALACGFAQERGSA
jgi:hypothetical protein